MLIRADELGFSTAFSRADEMVPCNIGGAGMCCKICGMGPCRLTKDGQTGVCGATIDTIQARNLIRSIAAGAAAHSDHGRDMAFTLKAVANGEAEGYLIRDVAKLRMVAGHYDIPIEGRSPTEIANELADLYIAQFGQQRGKIVPAIVPPRNARSSGKNRVSGRAASTAKWSKPCTAPISATTRTPSTFCSTPSAPPWQTAGAAA